MKTLLEHQAHKRLETVSELVEMTDTGEDVYSELRVEQEMLENSIVAGTFSEAVAKSKMSYGIRGKAVKMAKAPRVTRVYFADVEEVQARGFGMRQDDDGEWFMNAWGDKVNVLELNDYVKSKSIPFQISRYDTYGGRTYA